MTITETVMSLILAVLRRLGTQLSRDVPLALVFLGLPQETLAINARCVRELHMLDQAFQQKIPVDPYATQTALNLRRETEHLCRNTPEEPAPAGLHASATRLTIESTAKPQAQK